MRVFLWGQVLGFTGLLQLHDPASHTPSLSLLSAFCLRSAVESKRRSSADGGTRNEAQEDGGCKGAEEALVHVVLHLLQEVVLMRAFCQ